MRATRRDTLDTLSTLDETRSRRGSAQSNVVLVFPYRFDQMAADPSTTTTILSPPPTRRSPKPRAKNLHLRLRSDSGLALHTNQLAFRQYTNYSSNGSPLSGDTLKRPASYDATSTADTITLGNGRNPDVTEARQNKPLPSFFDPEVIKMAFSNPTTGQRLCQFAKSRRCAADVEFLLKVDEYSRAFESMSSLIGQISTNFTGITATSPLALPVDLSDSLKINTKHCARTVLPPLERLYRDARNSVEDRLARELYPDFVKFQLTQCMRSSMSVSRSLTGGFKSAYPGLGAAFCLTDPKKRDHPIVYASDGLLRLSGYQRREVIGRSCKLFQGLATDSDAAHRLRESIALGQDTVELIVNHRKDGTQFWNLLFVCPLLENGSIRYWLGAQINVSESMGSDAKDVLRVLSFGPPGEEFPPPTALSTQEQPIWRTPTTTATAQECVVPDVPVGSCSPPRNRSHRHRFFRHFYRKSDGARPQSPRPVTPVVVLPATAEDAPSAKRRAFTTRDARVERKPDEFSTPYSRFLIMRYVPAHEHLQPRGHQTARMPVAFCSSHALELMGHRSDSDAVLGQDIFSVLAGHVNLMGVSRSFKLTVTDKMAAGDSFSVDLMMNAESPMPTNHASKHSRNESMIRGGTAVNGVGAGAGASLAADADVRPRMSETFDRGAEILSHVFWGSKMRKLVSHWAPLKNADGEVAWVVLILTPAAAALA
ncbi:hypothetical protein QBC34DRAFT_296629 [Podospora aff. communis PSN243]|uniref:PAS domain-containing protein n=1 Tax=Podospora aff. communis PSN243 TaxID=3040156 RepID=A0AAV9GQV3_9PEZI|nr:hypothetical protein QBC34DRAFT_296629 [Podospora aff. communis PSN243]